MDYIILGTLLFLFIFCVYILWDSNSIYAAASSKEYEVFKPDVDDGLSFDQLKEINSEVFGWLTVYGTGIDYPLVQGKDNKKYLNRDALGKNTSYGALYLDHQNKTDFSDFSSIIYGHHMANHVMFGDLDLFEDADFFDRHRYGNLFFNGKDHGLEFMLFLKADAYDSRVYRFGISEGPQADEYLTLLRSKAINERSVELRQGEHIVLLSTCTEDITNGRYILVARITDEVFDNPFYTPPKEPSRFYTMFTKGRTPWSGIFDWPLFIWLLIILWLAVIVISLIRLIKRQRKKTKGDKHDK
ncbi:MAG: class B sortase [Ruminococcus sp.]|nr:class B sortase [Ruminococcus sp.]